MNIQTTNHTGTQTEPRYQCRHLFTDGHRCGSPSLRHEHFCYYHHTTRRPAPRKPIAWCGLNSEFELPLIEDRSSIQHAIGLILQRIAANQIDPRRAGLLLYGLQIASITLPREDRKSSRRSTIADAEPIDEIILDDTLGPLAPPTELPLEGKPNSIMAKLLTELLKPKPTELTAPSPSPAQEPGYPEVSTSGLLPTIQAVAEDRPTHHNRAPQHRVPQHRCPHGHRPSPRWLRITFSIHSPANKPPSAENR